MRPMDALYGFALETAIETNKATPGCFLFTGSIRLLEMQSIARPVIPQLSITSRPRLAPQSR